MSVKIKNIVRGDTLDFTLKLDMTFKQSELNENYLYDDYISSTKFSLEAFATTDSSSFMTYSVYIKFSKITPVSVDETVRVTSEALSFKDCIFKKDIQYRYDKIKLNVIDIKIQVLKPTLNKFNDLYDDEAMTDFELRANDGCVCFHRVVLALSSPVLKTMLSGKWKETAQGQVEVPGISKKTVQQFKDFIYKSVVPANVTLELHSLASYYMMTELEVICAEKIADSLTADNSWGILEYCASHKFTKLLSVILNRVKYGQIDDKVFV